MLVSKRKDFFSRDFFSGSMWKFQGCNKSLGFVFSGDSLICTMVNHHQTISDHGLGESVCLKKHLMQIQDLMVSLGHLSPEPKIDTEGFVWSVVCWFQTLTGWILFEKIVEIFQEPHVLNATSPSMPKALLGEVLLINKPWFQALFPRWKRGITLLSFPWWHWKEAGFVGWFAQVIRHWTLRVCSLAIPWCQQWWLWRLSRHAGVRKTQWSSKSGILQGFPRVTC